MKKTLFSLLALVALHAQATVLVVKEYGVNSTYSTINAALTAAVNNDTIVVYDKPSGQQWIEALTINKNLTFLHPTQGTRFKAPGQITVVPQAGMDLYFIGWDLNGNSITATATGSTATSANRAKITVTDCINVVNISLNVDWIDARVFYNQTNFTGQITMRHGIAVANVLANGGIQIAPESTTAAQGDSVIISGNKARWCYFDSQESGFIANNYLYLDNANNTWWGVGTGNALNIKNHNQSNNRTTWIVNNSITNAGGCSNVPRMAISIRYAGNVNNIKIINNLLYVDDGTCNNGVWAIYGDATAPNSNTGNPFISHNFVNTRSSVNYISFSVNNELNYYSNALNGFGSIDTWGRAASGNANLINKGNYLGQYYDIDLTRNDIGTYGGPFSIDNYLTGGVSKGRGLFIDIPHQLTNLNQIINAKAAAGSKF
jgi:hypothetical protein